MSTLHHRDLFARIFYSAFKRSGLRLQKRDNKTPGNHAWFRSVLKGTTHQLRCAQSPFPSLIDPLPRVGRTLALPLYTLDQ
jgi:hypothetical protein